MEAKTLTTQTQQFLAKAQIQADELEALRALIHAHDDLYYVQSRNVINDHEYDQLFALLKSFEAKHPELVTADSPTQRVAQGLNDKFETVDHLVPMLSLDNSYNAEDLLDFHERLVKQVGREDLRYSLEPKYDGASISLIYENDTLVRAATRGNGTQGDDITANAKMIRSIPLTANFSKYGILRAEIRGEVVIELGVFDQLNAAREKAELPLFKNSRNTASGGLRTKDPNDTKARRMEAFIYHLAVADNSEGRSLLGTQLSSHGGNIDMLAELGFKTPDWGRRSQVSIQDIATACAQAEGDRDSYNYEIDGMVIKLDGLAEQIEAGFTAHHPRWAIAYKFKARQATTTLLSIDYQVGRTGAVTPVAKLAPVYLAGVTISSVSVHNADFIQEKDLRIGDTVIVERAGDVIPYIAGAKKELRDGSEQVIHYPSHCPSCEESLEKPEEEAVWRCVNVDCPAQAEERLIHFVSKGAMDIEGLGKDIVKRFMQEGIISNMVDVFQIDYDQVLAMEGWKERSVQRLKNGVDAARENELWRLIVALGIRHVGGTTAKMLAKQVEHLADYAEWTEEQFLELEDVGPKVAQSLVAFFKQPKQLDKIRQLDALGVNVRNIQSAPNSARLEGMTFLFTGTLTKLKRQEAQALVEDNGGKLISGVSKKLNYLVAGEKAGSKLTKAQAIETIQIISEDDFLAMIA